MLDPNRKNYITASNIGAILGIGKYKTPNAVLRDMVKAYRGKLEYRDSPAMAHGRKTEAVGVAYANEFMEFVATGLHQAFVTKNFIGATPDGISKDGSTVLEIKCPYQQEYSAHNYELYMPEYYAQMQFQMYVTGATRALFVVVGSNKEISHIFVQYNEAYVNKQLPILKEFYDSFWKIIDTNSDIEHPEADRLQELSKSIKILQEEYDRIKDKIIKDNPNGGTFGNVSISVVSKKGTIDYKRIVTELKPDIDLEAYRGKSTNYYKVSIHDGSEDAGKKEADE